MVSVDAERFNRVGSQRSSGLSHVWTNIVFVPPTSEKRRAVRVLYETVRLVRVEEVRTLQTSVNSTQSGQLNQRRGGRQSFGMLLQRATGTYRCGKMGFHVSVFPLNFPVVVDVKGGKIWHVLVFDITRTLTGRM